ncbi:GTP-binding protein [Iocasia frigidifontis]|uniref:Fe(2+) transporter FeoB n=1 Tax=Iocasia fonsfrigidae TaxID=2682810 RepID=A0A8A7KCA8_9FIRM|nr:FeoB small GTPase domain-containing protein [Iocasia fonsfrigidae]QTL98880.1 GTP-binding protein [Iocasia fonsfrigidae]
MKNTGEYIVAVAGQPNSGKSTVFNMLTGARQFIANYPGVTVEKKIGIYNYKDQKIKLVDLPGTYSLTSYSLEERVARNFLIDEKPDLILNIVDASNLERHLNLTFQLLEMGLPMIIALNMIDVSQNRGFKIDLEKLSEELGVSVLPTVAKKGRGKDDLKLLIYDACNNKESYQNDFMIDYGETMENILTELEDKIAADNRFAGHLPRWMAVKLLAGDPEVRTMFSGN